jgi:hypothetical protein
LVIRDVSDAPNTTSLIKNVLPVMESFGESVPEPAVDGRMEHLTETGPSQVTNIRGGLEEDVDELYSPPNRQASIATAQVSSLFLMPCVECCSGD